MISAASEGNDTSDLVLRPEPMNTHEQNLQKELVHSPTASNTVFPRGQRELCIEDAVIVVSPLRVTHIIALLRRTMITVHVRGLSFDERASKMSKLYALITSAKYTQQFQEIGKLSTDIQTLDAGEKKAHDTTWKKRGSILARIMNALQDIDNEVAGVVEGEEPIDLAVAS